MRALVMTISVTLFFFIFLFIFVFSGHAGGEDPEPLLPSTPRAEEECRRSSSAANAPLSSSYSIGAATAASAARLFLQCIHR
jgi:hypothetical protein